MRRSQLLSSRAKLLTAAGAAVLALSLAGAGVWYIFIRDASPPPVSLETALESVQGSGTPQSTPGAPIDLKGRWEVAPGASSFVGYRVREQLARVGANTAVGRTQAVSGSLQFDGSSITSVELVADLTSLRSDESLRDGTLRRQGLEIDRFPSAKFVLTQPIPVGAQPAQGARVQATATGDLTLHGVTRRVAIDLEGQLSGGLVLVVGSLEILFADYGIQPPRAASVLSVEDKGTLELQLSFTKVQ